MMWNRNTGVGIFVVVGTTLFATGLFLIGDQHSFFAKHVEFYTEFRDLNGLAQGAKVRVAGFDAGKVKTISLPDSPSAGFHLTLELNQETRSLVRTDSMASIATEGVVGDKYVLIEPGSSKAAEAAPHTRLPSKEGGDMADLLKKGTALITDASGTIKLVSDKLSTALDSVTTTVNNANDLVVGMKQGRGAIGMLLRDEKTATGIRDAIANVREATSSLNHASAQADALVSDFQSRGLGGKLDGIVTDLQSRHLGDKLDQTMESAQSAAHNIDGTTRQLKEALAKALAPDAQGRNASDNVREALSNVSEATGNMAEDTEALKHGFFFRGFFKKRGYYSLAHLAPDKYRQDRVFTNPKNSRAWITAAELFDVKDGETEALSHAGKVRIDAALAELGDRAISSAIVVEGYATSAAPGSDMAVSRTRAILVREYLHTRFRMDAQYIGAVALRGVPPASTHKESWNGICIVSLAPSAG